MPGVQVGHGDADEVPGLPPVEEEHLPELPVPDTELHAVEATQHPIQVLAVRGQDGLKTDQVRGTVIMIKL